MNPEQPLEDQAESTRLIQILQLFAETVSPASDRLAILRSADVRLPNIKLDNSAFLFANALVSTFRQECISVLPIQKHSMRKFLVFLLTTDPEKTYGFSQDDVLFLRSLIEQLDVKQLVLQVRRSVGKVETLSQLGIGTGVLVSKNLFLTCSHVLSKSGVVSGKIRFGNKLDCDGSTISSGIALRFDSSDIVSRMDSADVDYVLICLRETPDLPFLEPSSTELNSGQHIRMIHHPHGGFATISNVGKITVLGDEYLDHDLPTVAGSSGAPIFNTQWEFIALHRGKISLSHRTTAPGDVTAMPVHAIWKHLQGSLTETE